MYGYAIRKQIDRFTEWVCPVHSLQPSVSIISCFLFENECLIYMQSNHHAIESEEKLCHKNILHAFCESGRLAIFAI
jgi:hypothetical protein